MTRILSEPHFQVNLALAILVASFCYFVTISSGSLNQVIHITCGHEICDWLVLIDQVMMLIECKLSNSS